MSFRPISCYDESRYNMPYSPKSSYKCHPTQTPCQTHSRLAIVHIENFTTLQPTQMARTHGRLLARDCTFSPRAREGKIEDAYSTTGYKPTHALSSQRRALCPVLTSTRRTTQCAHIGALTNSPE